MAENLEKNFVVENYNENKVYSNLTKEQNEVLQDVNKLLDFNKDDPDRLKKFVSRQKAAMNFEHEMRKEGIELKDYILFHRIIGSTPDSSVSKFDLSGKEIEEFITKFHTEFELNKKQK